MTIGRLETNMMVPPNHPFLPQLCGSLGRLPQKTFRAHCHRWNLKKPARAEARAGVFSKQAELIVARIGNAINFTGFGDGRRACK